MTGKSTEEIRSNRLAFQMRVLDMQIGQERALSTSDPNVMHGKDVIELRYE